METYPRNLGVGQGEINTSASLCLKDASIFSSVDIRKERNSQETCCILLLKQKQQQHQNI